MVFNCYVFIDPEAEAEAYVRQRSPVFRFPGVWGWGVNEARMAWLLWTLDGSPPGDPSPAQREAALAPPEVEYPLMCDFPNRSLHFLAGLCDAHLQGLASEWASASLWGRDRVEPGDLEDLLRGMRQLARHALFANCGMYLWVSVAGAEED